jgi:CheY-like chemotaxis protein
VILCELKREKFVYSQFTPHKEAAMPAIPNADLNVLLVDDDSFMLEFVTTLLGDLGISTVTTASDGKKGIDAFDRARAKPNLVLCDLHMPVSDGFQLMEELARRHYRGGVILISGEEERSLQSGTRAAQFHDLNILGALAKPVTGEALTHALNGFGTPLHGPA